MTIRPKDERKVSRFEELPDPKRPEDFNAVLIVPDPDPVNHPSHYTAGKIEAIEIIEDLEWGEAFCRGNALKYLIRAGKKDSGDPAKEVEDLKKCVWYVQREISRLEKKLK